MAASTAKSDALEREYAFYIGHKAELDQKYGRKFIVIKDENVIGPFEDAGTALTEALTKFQPGTFLIQRCGDEQSSVQYFHSRVAFH